MPSARGWGARHAGRCLTEGDFTCMVAGSTDSPHACRGSTCCPPTVAVKPPTIIGGLNSPCRMRSS